MTVEAERHDEGEDDWGRDEEEEVKEDEGEEQSYIRLNTLKQTHRHRSNNNSRNATKDTVRAAMAAGAVRAEGVRACVFHWQCSPAWAGPQRHR